ncbi:MAG TPA: hypothetical protein VF320_05160, partial [Acidimicrobiales bacterium]
MTLQSVDDPATGAAVTGVVGAGRAQEVVVAEAVVVVVVAEEDEHPARVPATTRATNDTPAARRARRA